MSRPILRLVESLDSSLKFEAGSLEGDKIKTIDDLCEVQSYLQLFLTWPEYSSACAIISGKKEKVNFVFDTAMSEIDSLLVSIDQVSFHRVKRNADCLERIYIEVFGITMGFNPVVSEAAEKFIEGEPNIALLVPVIIQRYTFRDTKRINVKADEKIEIKIGSSTLPAYLVDVSPVAFSVEMEQIDDSVTNRVQATVRERTFNATISKTCHGTILLKPILDEALSFGAYFDVYCEFAYPSLRSRFSFQEDPIPKLMELTGQSKKHASKEVGGSWLDEIQAAYQAAKDAKDLFCADYVVLNSDNIPVGTSSLSKVYLDKTGAQFWAFHGVGIVQDPSYLDLTCMLYQWRADYVQAREPWSPIVVWFDGRGRWLEKVYTKFQRLTSALTNISAIRHNRYVRSKPKDMGLISEVKWPNQKTVRAGRFERFMASDSCISIGLGVPFLNYSGILNNVFYWNNEPLTLDQKARIQKTVDIVSPDRFFIETPIDQEDMPVQGYDYFLVDATNRQCLTTVEALKCFLSSLEHSKAVVKRKYGQR